MCSNYRIQTKNYFWIWKMNEDTSANIIDLSFGWPNKKVVGGFYWSVLMQYENLAYEILYKAVKSVKTTVTLEMPMGWDDNSLNSPFLEKIRIWGYKND